MDTASREPPLLPAAYEVKPGLALAVQPEWQEAVPASCAPAPALAAAGGTSTLAAFAVLTKINWGIGMQAMPFYLQSAGLWGGLAFFVVSMALAADATLLVVRCLDAIRSAEEAEGRRGLPPMLGYGKLMRMMLGPVGEGCALFSLALANWGSCVAYVKYIGDNLARFVPGVAVSGAQWSLMLTVLLLACAFIEDISKMGHSSFLGLFAGQMFVVSVVVQALSHGHGFGAFLAGEPAVRWPSVPVAMGLAVFCNEGMVIVTPSVYSGMKSAERGFPKALAAMSVFFTLNYMTVAVLGYYLFSWVDDGDVPSEMTLGFKVNAVNSATVVFYLVQLMLSFPPVLLTVFSSYEQALLPGVRLRWRRLLRMLLILGLGLLAVQVPRFGDFLAVAGGLANSLGIYILPNLAVLRGASQGKLEIGRWRRLASILIIVFFGFAAGAVATVVSFRQLIGQGPSS